MPRKAFVADLQEASANFEKANVSDLRAGGEDGTINFNYHSKNEDTTEITILIPDLGEYPSSHTYMIFTDSNHVPESIHKALDSVGDFAGVKVSSMLSSLVRCLDKASTGSKDDPVDLDDENVMEVDSDASLEPADSYDGIESEEEWSQQPARHTVSSKNASQLDDASLVALNCTIRHDLGTAKEAGFRVSCLGSLFDGGQDGIVCLSIRVSKLGISDEALQAWHIDPTKYFVLLIRYTDGYKSFDKSSSVAQTSSSIQFQVGLHEKYKPDIQEATAAFVQQPGSKYSAKKFNPPPEGGIDPLFIGRPLSDLLNHRFLLLLKYRLGNGWGWRGAEEFFNDHQGRNLDGDDIDPRYWGEDLSDHSETLSQFVAADHLSEGPKEKSLPLLAMQYALRHLVRCTEFCLVCHCKIEVDFEALKPYVCSKPLCLYQYMSLGFGPSIEYEIITQPHVVDLLISFCFSSAYAHKLRDLPIGLALMVPDIESTIPLPLKTPALPLNLPLQTNKPTALAPARFLPHRAKYDTLSKDLLFPAGHKPPLQVGNWILFGHITNSSSENYHARVMEVLLPTVRLSDPIRNPRNKSDTLHKISAVVTKTFQRGRAGEPPVTLSTHSGSANLSNKYQEVEFSVYDQNFDDLDKGTKQRDICLVLDTLPSVPDMKQFLLANGPDASLRKWTERISPAALGMLRWIIASNRSCIMQVDSLDGSQSKPEDRVTGMPGWMQFRFAQGAPDKEQRFITSIKNRPASKFPTLFAWHGSPVHNWHMIVREGLHFETTAHGRAFGNGVYHALDVSTSLGYTGGGVYRKGDENTFGPYDWPVSQLKISQAVVLNEIVNAPDDFVSKSPHLVVSQLDWIQSRYLFVMCGTQKIISSETQLDRFHPQDPAYTPLGQNRALVRIPVTAVSRSRRQSTPSSVKTGNKKQKVDGFDDTIILSDDSDLEDHMMFFPTDKEESINKAADLSKQQQKVIEPPKTDFVPGTHDPKSLPLTHPPSYATSSATRTLQRELTSTLKTQDNTPPHELGWYIDRELVNNVYQWIIEMHSFEPSLPLAQDLKSKGLKSVVLEIRFGKDYPMTPPFVRVIRPRFLSFMEGGGGHVTAGGALCMELLTNSGWSAVSNVESVLLQVRLAMSSTDPRPAKLARGAVKDYSVGEAVDAYIRACNMHGWQIPPDFRTSYATSSAASAPFPSIP